MKIGSLFSGYGGLDLAVSAVTGADVAWHCEWDDAPSKILERNFPGVPNYRDVSKVDFAAVEPVDIITGGFPCQDLSLAGKRAGLKEGTRSGLWSEFARAIETITPPLVVIENVRGLLSATAHSTVEPCPWCLGDDNGEPALRALGAVLGDLADLGYDAQWTGVRAADAGAPHNRFRIFIVAWPSNSDGIGSIHGQLEVNPAEGGVYALSDFGSGSEYAGDVLAGIPLLRSPKASEGQGGALGEAEAVKRGNTVGVRDQIMDLVASQGMKVSRSDLLPTPLTGDSKSSRNSTANRTEPEKAHSGDTLTDIFVPNSRSKHLLPTPNTMDGLPARSGEALEKARKRGDDSRETLTTISNLREAVIHELLPTPVASEGIKAPSQQTSEEKAKTGQVWLSNAAKDMENAWGRFEPAIRRWEQILGRKAPAPTKADGKDGAHRLSSEFTEWMMGLPSGWVTDCGLTRNEELKACGNGVVPQQAELALRYLLGEVQK